MVAFDENTLPETNEMHGVTATDAHGVGLDDASSPTNPALSNRNPGRIIRTQRPGIFRRMRDAVLKPLFVMLTTQSIIAAVLVCLAAVVTAQHASQIISEKFSAINAALKRLSP